VKKFLLAGQQTSRLLFREINIADFDEWLTFFKDPSSFQYWKSELESPEKECQRWYEKQFDRYQTDRGGMNALVEKTSGRFIGHAGLLVQKVDGVTELEIAYSLLPSGRNAGFATEAAKKCMDYNFEEGFSDSLISIISLINTPSSNVARKNGMVASAQTVYNNNEVNIFRINSEAWRNLK
jgi:[ribosomal protein S5]-alanine N-acetyltransferase